MSIAPESIESAYRSCTMCPHNCRINRFERVGVCGETDTLRIAWAGLHFGEEPIITGTGGSGTIFITGCNLKCAFCQNYQISQEGIGRMVDTDEFIEICLRLQKAGAENVNIVTGTHQALRIAQAIQKAKHAGLHIPIVWNTSSYESTETIKQLSSVVDIWLADIKTLDAHIAQESFKVADYSGIAMQAIETMCAQSPLKYTEQKLQSPPVLTSGVIVRYLALPGRLDDSYNVLSWFSKKLKTKAILSLMTQYTPVEKNKKTACIACFENRLLKESEDKMLRQFLVELNIDDGFYQELVPDYSWLPDFTQVKTFSAQLSKPIWHYINGFV